MIVTVPLGYVLVVALATFAIGAVSNLNPGRKLDMYGVFVIALMLVATTTTIVWGMFLN